MAELQHTSTVMPDHVLNVFKLDRDLMTLGPEQQAAVNRTSESVGSTLVQSFRTARPDDILSLSNMLLVLDCVFLDPDRAQNASIKEIY